MAAEWRVLSIVTCIIFAERIDVALADGGFGSDAVIGIVVACVAVLLIVIAAVVIYMVYRSRRRAAKNTNPQGTGQDSTHDGHALPVSIPIEAVNRIPPPVYSQPENPRRSRPSASHRTTRQTTDLPPPPPYSPPPGNVSTIDISCSEAPPEYRSRVGLNSSAVVGIEPRVSNPQSISVESFVEYPSMRNILLTSSRSSLQGTDSRHASQSDRSSSAAAGSRRGSRGRGEAASPLGQGAANWRNSGGDSAHGDSVDSKSNRSDDVTNIRQTHRSISTSSSALYDPRLSVPEGGLQRKVRRSKQLQDQGATQSAVLNRSCPSLVSDETEEIMPRNIASDHPNSHHHHRHHRGRSDEEGGTSETKQQRRYKRKKNESRNRRLSSSTEYSGDPLQVIHGSRGYSTDSDASTMANGSPSSGPVRRFKVAGTCEV